MKIRKLFTFLVAVAFFGSAFATSVSAVHFETGIENGLIKRWSISTEHFRIEFSPVIKNQVDSDGDGIPDLVETVADAAEESWEVEIDDLNYDEPIEDSNHRVVIILDDTNEYLSSGAVGITSVLSNGEPYIALDPWMSDEYLQITLAHEFFHAIQFGHEIEFAYSNQGVNWAEATAVWMEEQVYDDIDDYVGYLYDYFDYPDYSVFAGITPSGTLFEYALSIWPIFLSEYYDDADIIQDIWDNYFDSNLEYYDDLKVYESVKDAVEDEGDELWQVYQDFTLWNLDWEQYEEGYYYPEPYLLEGAQGEYTIIEDYYAPALYGSNYLYFYNYDWEDDFYFHVIKSEGTSFVVSIVPVEYGDADLDNVTYAYIDENDDLTTELSVSGVDNAEAVVAIISPLESEWMDNDYGYSFDEGYLYYYLAQFGESIADEIETDTEIEDSSYEKEGEDSTMDESSQNDDTISLSLLSYDEDSATFSWTRLADDDIEGYVLEYGTESGDYDEEVEIDKPQTTYSSIEDLEEGETYYFSVYAIDEDGDQVGDESNEVAVVPEEWLFTDVSHMSDYAGAIEVLVDEGIFEGYSDGSFDPNGTINRAELLKILIEGQGLEPSASYSYCFDDVKDDWYAKYVCYAESKGWVKGYPDGNFKPANPVNKVEALKILFNVYEAGLVEGTRVSELPYPDLGLQAWYSIYVYEAAALGLLSEEQGEDFNASDGRTRSDMAEELYRYLVVEDLI